MNFWLDVFLLVNFVAVGIASTIIQFVFPPGTKAAGWFLWSLSYNQWITVQFALLAVFSVAVVVHVMLHWTWICAVITRQLVRQSELPDDGIRTLFGVGLLIVVLITAAAAVGVATVTIQMPPQ